MLLTKPKTAAALLFAAMFAQPALADKRENPSADKPVAETTTGRISAVDADKNTITLSLIVTKGSPAVNKTFDVARDARITIESKAVKLSDLTTKMNVTLTLKDAKVVLVQVAEKRGGGTTSIQGVLKAESAEKNTITLTVSGSKGQPPEDRTFDVDKNAKILIDHSKSAKLADLPLGSQIQLALSKEQKAIGIVAVGPTIAGTIKEVNAGKNTVTVSVHAGKGNPTEDKTFDVAKEARISLDKSKQVKLSELVEGARITFTLSLDQKNALVLNAITPRPEPSSVKGLLSAVDAQTNKITITVGKGKGQPTEEQSFSVPKEAKLLIDLEKPAKLSDLKTGATIALELSADQKVTTIRAVGPTIFGVFKSVDATKSVMIVTVNATKATPGEDKEFNLAKDAKFWVGKEMVKPTDLPAGARVTLSLSVDEKLVIGVRTDAQ